ncbi:hypothetical protein PVAP13_9NG453300 [Panicum virgatum]|uniref:RING-type E3 ubiquitin transferase n=1 Tax=Panicum virgatum TaxID=38727 RepID=A0A8T0MPZ2_PANVG|nr:hypothetical protein PVAP13_9NG453300 [Panicum virgatum]
MVHVGVVPSRCRLRRVVKLTAPPSQDTDDAQPNARPREPAMSHTRTRLPKSLAGSSLPMLTWTRSWPRPRAASSSMPSTTTTAPTAPPPGPPRGRVPPRGRPRRGSRSRCCCRCSSSSCSSSASSPSSSCATSSTSSPSGSAGAGAGATPDAHAPPKPAGLDPAVLATFPTARWIEATPQSPTPARAECVVCLSEFAAGDAVRLLTVCRHAFHTACIDSWLAAHTTCPVCRSELDAPPPRPGDGDGGRIAIVVDGQRPSTAVAETDQTTSNPASGGVRSRPDR